MVGLAGFIEREVAVSEQFPPIVARVGEVTGPKPPGKLEPHWIVLAWEAKNEFWAIKGAFWFRKSAAEEYARERLPPKYTHYRIVEIHGDK